MLRRKACRMRQRQPMWRNRRLLVSDALAMGGRAPRPTVAPSTWSATMRRWRQASAARCVGAGACIGSRQESRSGWMGMRSCPRCAMSWKSSGVPPVAKCSRRRAGKRGQTNTAPGHGRSWCWGATTWGCLYRLEGYQAMVGVPVADATQWDQIERVADCAYPVFEQLRPWRRKAR